MILVHFSRGKMVKYGDAGLYRMAPKLFSRPPISLQLTHTGDTPNTCRIVDTMSVTDVPQLDAASVPLQDHDDHDREYYRRTPLAYQHI